jgi:hypothetical protein
MNGISLENPFSFLMNIGTGTSLGSDLNGMPGMMNDGSPSTDLLGFVNALEISQGPKSALGENLDAMVNEFVSTDLEKQKALSHMQAPSGDLLSSIALGLSVPSEVSNSMAKIKTNDKIDVGHTEISNLLKESKNSKVISGETQLLGDLISVEAISEKSLPNKAFSKPIKDSDVAMWTKAFAQNDIKSVELINDQPSELNAAVKMSKLSSVDEVVLGSQVKPELFAASHVPKFAQPKVIQVPGKSQTESVSGDQQNSAKGFSTFVRSEAEPVKTPEPESGFQMFKDEPKTKELVSETATVATDAGDLMLGKDFLLAASPSKDISSGAVLKAADQLGSSADLRLNDDSVKMLADKIESLKENGSSTLRMVVSPNESGKIEIRVQKIAGEMRVSLKSDSQEVTRALEVSKADLVAQLSNQLSDKTKVASVEVRSELLGSMSESSGLSSGKGVIHSGDLIRMGQNQDAKLNLASSQDFGSESSGGKNPEFMDQSGRESSRDRGMKKWQTTFEERESA